MYYTLHHRTNMCWLQTIFTFLSFNLYHASPCDWQTVAARPTSSLYFQKCRKDRPCQRFVFREGVYYPLPPLSCWRPCICKSTQYVLTFYRNPFMWFIPFFQFSNFPEQGGGLAFGAVLFGTFGLALFPVALELGVECTYPIREGTSSGLLQISG